MYTKKAYIMLAASFINHIDWKFTINILHVDVYLMKHKNAFT